MLNRVYKRVFGGSGVGFHAEKNYFIELLDFSGEASYAESLPASIDHYIGREFYECRKVSPEEVKDEAFGDSLRQFRNRMHYDFCYALLFDYREQDIGETLAEVVKAIRENKVLKQRDRLFVMLTLPDNDRLATRFLQTLEQLALPPELTVYALVNRSYEEKRLTDDLCGILLLNSDREQLACVEKNRTNADVSIQAVISTFPTVGQEKFARRRKVFWSSVSASYSDAKMDFLQYYLYRLSKNVLEIGDLGLRKLCEEFYDKQVAINDMEGCGRKLFYAIRMIPRVTNVKIDYDVSLDRYFDQLYGTDGTRGSDVVELTLKVNLSRLPSYTASLVEEAAKFLFDKAKAYHSDDLLRDVVSAVDTYLGEADKVIFERQKHLRDFLQSEGSAESDLQEYIQRYLVYANDLRRRAFFGDVRAFMTTHREVFSDEIDSSRALARQLAEFRKAYSYLENLRYPSLELQRYPAGVLLNADRDEGLCSLLREEFTKISEEAEQVREPLPQEIIDTIFDIKQFCCDYEYHFLVHDTYTVNIRQRFGTYCEFS